MDQRATDKKKIRAEVMEIADKIIEEHKDLLKKLAREDREW